MKIYHTSPTKIEKIEKDKGIFGDVLFFSDKIYSMSNVVRAVYSVDLEDEDILETTRIFYLKNITDAEREAIKMAVERIAYVYDLEYEQAADLLDDSENSYDFIDDFEKAADCGWFVQRVQAELARDLGYVAASSIDEQGTVYMISMFERDNMLKYEQGLQDAA